MKLHKGTIENWEEFYTRIKGIPVGHPDFIDWIITSRVIKREGNEIETLYSRYTLGKPKQAT